MTAENFTNSVIRLLDEKGMRPDQQQTENIRDAVHAWLDENAIQFEHAPSSATLTLTQTSRSTENNAGLSLFSNQIKKIADVAKLTNDKSQRTKVTTHRLAISETGFKHTQETSGDTGLPKLTFWSPEQDEYNNTSSSKSQKTKIANFLGLKECKDRISDLKTHILNIMSVEKSHDKIGNMHVIAFDPNRRASIPNSDLHDSLETALAKSERKRRLAVARQFRDVLDDDVVEIMRATSNESLTAIEWLYADGDAKKQKYRRQAAQAYPLLFSLMVADDADSLTHSGGIIKFYNKGKGENQDSKTPKASHEMLSNVIDNGEPLAAFLQTHDIGDEYKAISARVLRSVGRIKTLPTDLKTRDLFRYLPYLEHIDSSWHPRTSEELSDFMTCAERINVLHKKTGKPIEEILQTTRGQWAWWNDRTVSTDAIEKIHKWTSAVYKNILAPQVYLAAEEAGLTRPESHFQEDWIKALLGKTKRGLIRDFFAEYSVLEMLDCAEHWHEHANSYQTQMEALHAETCTNDSEIEQKWLSLSKPYRASNGIVIEAVTTQDGLISAGEKDDQGLHCCLGTHGYWQKCMAKYDHIVVLHDQDGKRLSAAQIREKRDEDGKVTGFTTAQHEGKGRTTPTEADEKALTEYLEALFQDADYMPDFEAIENARNDNRKVFWKAGISEVIGFDPSTDHARTRATEIVQQFLPKALRSLDANAIMTVNDMSEKALQRAQEAYEALVDEKSTIMEDFHDAAGGHEPVNLEAIDQRFNALVQGGNRNNVAIYNHDIHEIRHNTEEQETPTMSMFVHIPTPQDRMNVVMPEYFNRHHFG